MDREQKNAYMREYYKKNIVARRAYQREFRKTFIGKLSYKRTELKREYGITIEQYDEILLKQENKCAICQIHQSQLKGSLCVDHCHSSGKVRGLLCRHCNNAIGLFEDSKERLNRAITYLGVPNGS